MTPSLSIIIPTYNSALSIRVALESIFKQDYKNFEIIIVDSLSSDDTLDIVNSYCDERVVIISEKDNGIYDAMNKGVIKARGQWIYFLGSDDYIISHKLFSYLFFECESQIHDYQMLYGNVLWGDTATLYLGFFDDQKLYHFNICHQGIFYKREVFDILGLFDLRYPALADWKMNIECFLSKRILIKYYPILVARFNTNGSSQYFTDDFKSTIPELYKFYIDNYNFFEKLKYKVFMRDVFGPKNRIAYLFYKLTYSILFRLKFSN